MVLSFKRKKVEGSAERLLCIGMIVSDRVLREISMMLDETFMPSSYARRVTGWCLKYWEQFQKAPGSHIQHLFESEKRAGMEEEEAELIESLLSGLSSDFSADESFNEDYVLSEAEIFVKKIKATQTAEDVLSLVSRGRIVEAEGLIASYNIPERPMIDSLDVFTKDGSFWVEEEKEELVLFRLPGALGDLLGPVERDSFISFLAPEKVGKTWWLLYFALLAYKAGRNVLFLSTGDMTTKQIRRRLRHMLTGQDPKFPKQTVKSPVVDCAHNIFGTCPLGEKTSPAIVEGSQELWSQIGDEESHPNHTVCTRCRGGRFEEHFIGRPWVQEFPVSAKPIEAACLNMVKRHPNKRQLRIACYPPQSINVGSISAKLSILEYAEGFIPDVIVIDYADLLMEEDGKSRMEYRHRINENWMSLRALSQTRNCAVITATQAKIEARRKAQVDQWDTSEDKRKLAHVTAMIALNQTAEEKRKGYMRLSNIAMRDGEFDVNFNVGVLQCLARGQVHIASFAHKDLKIGKGKKDDERKSMRNHSF